MNWKIALFLMPSLSFAARIPVEAFDQGKLEQLLRRIPSALVKTEEKAGYVRRHTQFPPAKTAPFVINCQADFYAGAIYPSTKTCQVDVDGEPRVGDEFVLTIKDPSILAGLTTAISYGGDVKKYISNELVYAQSANGKYKNIFRFSFVCKTEDCEVTFATKEASY